MKKPKKVKEPKPEKAKKEKVRKGGKLVEMDWEEIAQSRGGVSINDAGEICVE